MFSIFTKENCIFCDKAKFLLQKYGIKYEEFPQTQENILKYIDMPNKKLQMKMTYPQIFNDTFHIGGYEDLRIYLKEFYNG